MLDKLKIYFFKKLYKLLIIKTSFVDSPDLQTYKKFKIFCTLPLCTNKGIFTFIFKEDRRSRIRTKAVSPLVLSSYFVELKCPEGLMIDNNIFTDKVIVVVKIRTFMKLNYEALASLLLDLYIEKFTPKAIH